MDLFGVVDYGAFWGGRLWTFLGWLTMDLFGVVDCGPFWGGRLWTFLGW